MCGERKQDPDRSESAFEAAYEAPAIASLPDIDLLFRYATLVDQSFHRKLTATEQEEVEHLERRFDEAEARRMRPLRSAVVKLRDDLMADE